jgi:hypothetical protein
MSYAVRFLKHYMHSMVWCVMIITILIIAVEIIVIAVEIIVIRTVIVIEVIVIVQGDTRPTGAVPPRLPVSVRRSATLAKRSALLKGDGSQVNELRRRCCEGVMFLNWSNVCCSVLLCYYCVQSGMLHV